MGAGMISLDSTNSDWRLYRVEREEFPENTYIICSEPSRRILYNPQMAGRELQEEMERMSPIFIKAATQKALRGARLDDVVEFVLLAGGLYYSMARGFREVHGHALPQCFLGIKRQRVEGSEGQFRAVSTYENFESLPKESAVIIGDTIATGATIVRALRQLEDAAAEREGKVRRLVVCSLACSTEGARRLGKLEKEMRARDPEFRIWLIVAEQLFHLMPDGTDMRFLREDVVVPEESREYTISRYGEALGKGMKCAIFDWGTRCKNPKAHYREFLEFCDEILGNGNLDGKGQSEVERMKAEALRGMEAFGKGL